MLCGTCTNFNVQELYRAASQLVKKGQPKKRTGNVFAQYDGIPEFYKHQPSLALLKTSAYAGCELCSIIWKSFSEGKAGPELNERLNAPPSDSDQIFLGLTQWSPESHGFPYVAAIQAGRVTRTIATFEAFAPRETFPIGFEHLLARGVASDPASPVCLAAAAEWINDCKKNHKGCKKLSSSKKLPTRVLDVGPSDGSQEPRLFVTNGMEADWVALSYCWGGDSVFILKKERLERWQQEIPLSSFPATLRDAIVVTRSLGVRYIWIDALCIIQDSKDDWAAEAAKMGDVYRGACVTVSAAASPKTNYGILKERKPAGMSCQVPWNGSRDCSVHLRSGYTFWDGIQSNGPLNGRGWTLQESLLAPRTLSYGFQQMAWECQELQVDEAGRPIASGDNYRDKHFLQSLLNSAPSAAERFMRKKLLNKLATSSEKWDGFLVSNKLFAEWQRPYNRWLGIVKEYTSRNLTVATDVLPALAGLAAAFQPVLEDQYCAGIWRNDMIRGLLWSRLPYERNAVSSGKDRPKYKAPSWSWASIEGRKATFSYPPADSNVEGMHRAKVIDVIIDTVTDNSYGQIKGGYMDIQGALCDIDSPLMEPSKNSKFPLLQKLLSKYFTGSTGVRAEYNVQHEGFEGQKFAALVLQKYTENNFLSADKKDLFRHVADLLILETTGSQHAEYRRIALHRIASYNDEAQWEETRAQLEEIDNGSSKDVKIRVV